MKNFIDFVVDSAKESTLAEELKTHIEGSDHKTISSWLSSKGYDVHEDDVKKMVDNKEEIKNSNLGLLY
ncbi:hypothetical protein EW093_06720 [Thiospirochaeta perfilievii]|uniref:Nif11 family protein n=1 Tax=Thiospirochaeta perfilievii TaxID=252967 RepID=A0A5C1QA93_9SPIO|nr:hypothetical protein [Thiospirochaeta perfilievii]QEN04401.1 hypothetical protein EW093_06720 [Thiospirochaeta perfilievii]